MEYGKNRVMAVQAADDEPRTPLTVSMGMDGGGTLVSITAPQGSVDGATLRRLAESAIDVIAKEARARADRRRSEELMRSIEKEARRFEAPRHSTFLGLDWGERG